MKASERIRRGFWRIGLLGPIVGAVVVAALLGSAGLNALSGSVEMYAMGATRTVPKKQSAIEASRLINAWFDGLSEKDQQQYARAPYSALLQYGENRGELSLEQKSLLREAREFGHILPQGQVAPRPLSPEEISRLRPVSPEEVRRLGLEPEGRSLEVLNKIKKMVLIGSPTPEEIMDQVERTALDRVIQPLTYALAWAICGMAWLGFWLLLSWLVRGFLA